MVRGVGVGVGLWLGAWMLFACDASDQNSNSAGPLVGAMAQPMLPSAGAPGAPPTAGGLATSPSAAGGLGGGGTPAAGGGGGGGAGGAVLVGGHAAPSSGGAGGGMHGESGRHASGGSGGMTGGAGGGSAAGTGAPSTGAATFSSLYTSIMTPKCVPCHGAGVVPFQTKDEAYQSLVGIEAMDYCPGMKRVLAGDPDASVLILALKAQGCREGRPMPPSGMRLSDAEVQRFTAWIKAGAKND